jgi:hypothetical protein
MAHLANRHCSIGIYPVIKESTTLGHARALPASTEGQSRIQLPHVFWERSNKLIEEMLLRQRKVRHRLGFAVHAISHDGLHWVSCATVDSYTGLTNSSGSTSISGMALLNFMSCFVTVRQFFTISIRFFRLYDATEPLSNPALETNITLDCGSNGWTLY